MVSLSDDWPGKDEARRWVEWVVELIGETEWKRRRADIQAFHEEIQHHRRINLYTEPFVPDDLAAWHLYICETFVTNPLSYPLAQGARNIPVAIAIMQEWKRLRDIEGVGERIRHAFLHQPKQFDTTLFEILVAAAYVRNRWKVAFIPENPPTKTPDLEAIRAGKKLYV